MLNDILTYLLHVYDIYGVRMSETASTGNDPYIEIDYTVSGGSAPDNTILELVFW